MQKQTRIQRETGINTERAWVVLDTPITLDAIETKSPEVRIKGHYTLKNFGDGPAFKVVQAGLFVTPPPTNMEFQKTEADFFCESSVRFATGTVGDKQPAPFGHILFSGQWDSYPIEFQGPQETAKHLRFIGCVAYLDQFSTVDWTRFCMERRPGDATPVPKLDFCSMYNDTDEPKKSKPARQPKF